MRKIMLAFVFATTLLACNNSNSTPDVSNIKVPLSTLRFEKDLFALDSNKLDEGLTALQKKYPDFFSDYIEKMIGIDGDMIQRGEASKMIQSFCDSYKTVYDSTRKVFTDFTPYENEIKKGLQFVKYYFPNYKLPTKIITFVAPLDASFKTSFGLQGDVNIVNSGVIGVGLQLHLGSQFSFYQSEQGQQLYPTYISNRFDASNIASNCIKNIIDDLYPEKLEDKTMVQQMVEKGKRLFLLSKLLPNEEDYKLIGYTKAQMKDCIDHEASIWNLFIQNSFLQTIDNSVIKNYIGESPKTQELGEASPGNIGTFAGWQIVKKYMSKNNKTTLPQLMEMDNDALFAQAKYKP
jgi:hypothetical protein